MRKSSWRNVRKPAHLLSWARLRTLVTPPSGLIRGSFISVPLHPELDGL